MVERNFGNGIDARFYHKDLHIVLDLAHELGLPVPACALVKQQFNAMMARGEFQRPKPKASSFNIVAPQDLAWVDAKMTTQPLGVALQPIRMSGARDRVKKKAYIRTTVSNNTFFDGFAAKLKTRAGWRVYEETCGHDMMVDQPERLADILVDCA